jgi:hypothetical protein
MAGYVGTQARSGGLGARRARLSASSLLPVPVRLQAPSRLSGDARAADMPRRRLRGVSAVRAQGRQTRVGYVMIGIVVAFVIGLFSLSQTVRVSAMDYDLDALLVNRQQLESTSRDLRATLARLGSEPSIRRQALDAGLGQVLDPLVLPAR